MFGFIGSLLRFDLTKNLVTTETLSNEFLKEWIGGTGLGVKYIYDEVNPSITWDDPENRFVLASGPLGGTSIKGSGTYSIVTKGPMTGGLATTQACGYLGAFLRFCGYQGLIIQGCAEDWVYLYIDNDKAEIKSASHLVGLDTVQTQDAILREYGLKPTQLSVCCIGPAGENLVRFACVVGDYGHVAAHNGVGAVLGSKKVKAIAVRRGKNAVKLYDKGLLREISTQINNAALNNPAGKDTSQWGTNAIHSMLHKLGALPIKNLTTSIFPEHASYDSNNVREKKYEYKKRPCWACNWSHCGFIKIKSGPFKGFKAEEPEYEGMASMGPLIGISDPTLSIVLADWVDRLGMDVNETGWLVAWVMECFEKGYITSEELDGLEMNWGSFYNTKLLLQNVAQRQGLGSVLAEGVMRAAKTIGGPALECAVFTEKGNTPRSHDHRAMWIEYLDTCVSNTGTIETSGGGINAKQHGLEQVSNPFDWEQIARNNAALSGRRVFEDSLGICRLCACEDINLTVKALNAATGEAFTLESVMRIGKRVINLMRIYNNKAGITSELDKPSPRYASAPADGPVAGISVGKVFNQMKELYYELMGWDKKTGVPLPETLEGLGLTDVIKDCK